MVDLFNFHIGREQSKEFYVFLQLRGTIFHNIPTLKRLCHQATILHAYVVHCTKVLNYFFGQEMVVNLTFMGKALIR